MSFFWLPTPKNHIKMYFLSPFFDIKHRSDTGFQYNMAYAGVLYDFLGNFCIGPS